MYQNLSKFCEQKDNSFYFKLILKMNVSKIFFLFLLLYLIRYNLNIIIFLDSNDNIEKIYFKFIQLNDLPNCDHY